MPQLLDGVDLADPRPPYEDLESQRQLSGPSFPQAMPPDEQRSCNMMIMNDYKEGKGAMNLNR